VNLLLSLVCDDATEDPHGYLDAEGVRHDLYAPGFPAMQERLVVVMVVEWDRTDFGRYSFRVEMRGPGGELVGPAGRPTPWVEGHTEVHRPPDGRPPSRTRLVLPLERVVFPEPGRYRFRLTAKGRELEGPVVYLTRIEPPIEPADTGGGPPG
jgi:hypothetical protein